MANTPMTAMPIRQLNALDMGSQLIGNPNDPFAMANAQQMMAQQEAMAQEQEQVSPEQQMIEELQAKKDALANSNKVKELILKIKDEFQKQSELDATIEENKDAITAVMELLSNARQEIK